MTPLDVRRRLWALFVRRATDAAKLNRGLSIPKIAKLAGIAPATIYRWLDGDWETAPKGEAVEAFCDALDQPTGPAFQILFPGKAGDAPGVEPLAPDPDFETLQRKLNDPATTEQEKFHIRETIRTLALRGR